MPAIRAQMPVVHALKPNMVAQNFACPAYMYTDAAQNSEPAALTVLTTTLTVLTTTLTAGTVAQDLQPATLTVGAVALIYR